LTALSVLLTAGVSGLLLWLAWLLVGDVVATVPQLPSGSTVVVNGVDVDASQLAGTLANHAREMVLKAGSIAFVCVVLAAAVLAWTSTGRLLRPLHEVTGTARRLSAESLGERITPHGARDEVAELAATFNAMLDRLQASFETQRRFVANASHELRTPLSVIRTELDVTLADPDADVADLRRMAEVVGRAAGRATQLVEALLLLARTDGTGLAAREPVDLSAVAAAAWQAGCGEATALGLHATFDTEPATAIGDPALLERVAGNLLENAVRHNVAGGWVQVRTGTDQRFAVLRVSSSGQPVDADRVAELFEPFRRGGIARTARSGAGLGLSIVRAVVAAHGGEVYSEAVSGGGLTVTVRLPAVLSGRDERRT
jgi:hypothetical protein